MPKNKDLLLQMLSGGVEKGIGVGAAGAQQAMKQQHETEEAATKRSAAQSLFDMLKKTNPKSKIAVNADGGMTVDPEAPLSPYQMRPMLTPAQEAAEKAAGKHIEDYEAAGGRPALEKNLASLGEVESELKEGKRDGYDRLMGSATSWSPTLMGLLAPTEKARRDKARNTALDAVKKTDANPTQQQIDAVMGQIYDPSSDNQANADRISRFNEEQRKTAAQREQAAANYHRSGYATFGGPKQPAGPQGPSKIRVSNGKEVLEIDPSDVAAAEADGYRRMAQ